MRHYLVTDTLTGHSQIVMLEEAVRIAQLAEEEIDWALKENGICETGRHTICDISDADVFDLTELTGLAAVEA